MSYWDDLLAHSPEMMLKLDDPSGSTGALDSSGNGRGMLLQGTPTFGEESIIPAQLGESCVYTDGNSEWLYRAHESWMNADTYSVVFTVKPESLSKTRSEVFGIVEQIQLWLLSNGGASCYMQMPAGWTLFSAPAGTFSAGVVHHVAWVRDAVAGTFRLYVNGVAVVSVTGNTNATRDNTTHLRFGSSSTSPTGFGLQGWLQGAAWFNKALSQEEVEALYASHSAASNDPPTAPTITSPTEGQVVDDSLTVVWDASADDSAGGSVSPPSSLAGMTYWLDAEREAARLGLTPGDSVLLDTWHDESGAEIHSDAFAGVGSQPTLLHDGSRWVVRFSGAQRMTFNVFAASELTVFLVSTPSSVANSYLLSGQQSASAPAIISGYSGVRYEWYTGGDRESYGVTSDGHHIVVGRHITGGLLTGRADGAEVFSVVPTFTAGTNYRVLGSASSGGYATFDACAFLMFARALTDAEIESVEAYLDEQHTLGLGLAPVPLQYEGDYWDGAQWDVLFALQEEREFLWDVSALAEGEYGVRVRANDGTQYGDYDEVLFSILRNLAPSTPQVTSPAAGDTVFGVTEVTWAPASDADDDPLQYEGDYWDGVQWVTLFALQPGLSFTWDTAAVPAGAYRVRVRAHDGTLYSGYAESGVFDVITAGFVECSSAGASPFETCPPVVPEEPTGGEYADAVMSGDPILYWRLQDEREVTAEDASGYGHDGTYEGDVTHEVGGLIPGSVFAVALGEGAYVERAFDLWMDVGAGADPHFLMLAEGWAQVPDTINEYVLASMPNAWEVFTVGGGLYLRWIGDVSIAPGPEDPSIEAGVPFYFAFMQDSNIRSLVLDEQVIGSVIGGLAARNQGASFYVGRGASDEHVGGFRVDEVAVYVDDAALAAWSTRESRYAARLAEETIPSSSPFVSCDAPGASRWTECV